MTEIIKKEANWKNVVLMFITAVLLVAGGLLAGTVMVGNDKQVVVIAKEDYQDFQEFKQIIKDGQDQVKATKFEQLKETNQSN